MASQLTTYVTPQEYLELERKAAAKHEYLKGEVFAMTGASLKHNRITVNIAAELKRQLKQTDCDVLVSDMHVAAPGATLYTYPDVVVVCDEPQLQDSHFDTLLNPCLIIEVLSKSTAPYDLEIKFGYYRTIESLTEYLVVAQAEHYVAQHVRQPDGRWLITDIRGLETRIELASVPCTLALAEVYERASLD
ncbi:MAG TPA: Uma2 family endonuclease [Pyrinomonadaceae bacterium]|jgi:Uma2 family endonuclease